MGHGGRRAGAGRKSDTEKYGESVNAAKEKIADRLPQIVDALLQLAIGAYVEEVNIVTGKRQVYKRLPDRAAAEYLFDRLAGKPTQVQDVTMQQEVTNKVYERTDDFDPDDA